MKTSSQIWLDQNLIGPLIRLLNLLVIPAGRILKLDHSLDKSFKVISICKFKGMGSILLATPLIKTLRANYPDARIIFISSSANKQILQKIKDLHEVILINDGTFFKFLIELPSFIIKLVRTRIEVYIDLEVYSNFSSLIALLSLARNRMGFYLHSRKFRLGNYTHLMYYNTRSNISETYLQFARMLGCEHLVKDYSVLESDIVKIQFSGDETFMLSDENYIAINPNASDLGIERRWPLYHYVKLIQLISGKYPDLKIILIGSGSEAAYVNKIIEQCGKIRNIYSFAGKTDISGLISLVKFAKVFITNDSGPMHISFITGAKTVALLGPVSPRKYGNFSNVCMIYANIYCSPCVHEFIHPPCNGNNLCMKAIEPIQVFESVKKMINQEIQNNPEQESPIKFDLGIAGEKYIAGMMKQKF